MFNEKFFLNGGINMKWKDS